MDKNHRNWGHRKIGLAYWSDLVLICLEGDTLDEVIGHDQLFVIYCLRPD